MSLSDSYQNFEVYLDQVNDELMRVFQDWDTSYSPGAHNSELNKVSDPIIHYGRRSTTNDSEELGNYDIRRTLSNDDNSIVNDENSVINWNLEKFENFGCRAYVPWLYFQPDIYSTKYYNGESLNSSCASMNSSELPIQKIMENNGSPSICNLKSEINQNDSGSRSFDDFSTRFCTEQNSNIDYSIISIQNKMTIKVNKQTSSQFDRHLAEIEATEACKWLRAAGFPQYAQMYEDTQFPVDLVVVQQDHPFLEPTVLQSLFRRLNVLNQCATVCQQPCSHRDDSEDEQCALSDNWTYQSDIRRWSRTHELEELQSIQNQENQSISQIENKDHNILRNSDKCHSKLLQTKDKKILWRAASTKFRNHREGMVFNNVSPINTVSNARLKRFSTRDESPPSDFDYSVTIDITKVEEGKVFKDHTLLTNTETDDSKAVGNEVVQIDGKSMFSLSCTHLQILRKLALLKLTAYIEKYCPSHRTGWNWEVPKFIKKIRTPMYKENQLLNLPLAGVLQRTGQPLPKGIQEALEWLRLNGFDQVGLFRKPGVRSRIQLLKSLVESQGESINYNDQQSYDVADMVKQYFRELPEPVLTNKLSETFMLLFQHVPLNLRKEAVLCTLLLMPDEHREVLQTLLYFLLKIAKHSDINQMTDSNLAICFAPSLFQYTSHSIFCRQGSGSPNPRELIEVKAAQECLLYFLKNNEHIFNIPRDFLRQCKLSEMNDTMAVQLTELGSSMEGGWQGYMNECQMALLKELREKNRGWVVIPSVQPKVELSYKKVDDGHPLKLWKVSTEIEAPPIEVLHRILRERHLWDDDLHSAKIIAQMNNNSEVFHYVRRQMVPLPYVDYCVLRTWNTDLPRGSCAILETSVEHPDIPNIPNTVRGIVLASRYLIEPGGSGRTRLLHLSRADTRGRMPEWYHKNFGHLDAIHVAHIQSSFCQSTTGPESKV